MRLKEQRFAPAPPETSVRVDTKYRLRDTQTLDNPRIDQY